MTFLHKLAKRLSLTGSTGIVRLLACTALVAGCAPAEDRDLLGTAPSGLTPPIAMGISPRVGSVKPGEEIRFTATGRSAAGGTVPLEVEWQADGGTITADGRFVAAQFGQFRVSARARQYPHLADSALVAVFNAPTDILVLSVTPDSSLITEGEGIQLEAQARLADGTALSRPPVRWSASGGQVDGSGWFSALTPGDYRVEATSTGGIRAQATILVRPTQRVLQSIEAAPHTLRLAQGESRQMAAIARYTDGTEGVAQVTWSATGGTIRSDGVYTAGGSTGNHRIIARAPSGLVADTVSVSITEPELQEVRISPAVLEMAPGATHRFSAFGVYADGSAQGVGVQWTATGGAISVGGQYTAGNSAGTYRIVGTVAGTALADTAVVHVMLSSAILERVIVNPSAVTVPLGATRQFTVSGIYADGEIRTPAVTWSATGGTISSGGLYTPGTVLGTFRVVATAQGGRADTSVVTIVGPELEQVLLNPSAVTLAPGGTRAFTVAGRWSDGSSMAPTVSFQAEGGSITADGVYTAGTQPGTWRLIARQVGGALADTSLITIEPPAPSLVRLTVSPKTLTVRPGYIANLTVAGQWSDGSSQAPLVTWTASGGQVSPQGVFSAGTAEGTYQIIARSQDGRLADTSRVTVAAAAPTLVSLAVSPGQTTLQVGGSRQFYASGTLSDGSSDAPAVIWTATGGTITDGGLYVASKAGSYLVIARQQGGTVADTAEVLVAQAPTLVQVAVTPDSATLQVGQSVSLEANGVWSNGATAVTPVAWTATGGSITTAGEYHAGAQAGTYRVIARSTTASLADTVVIRVTAAPVVASLRVTPKSASLAAGASHQFAAEATYSDGVVRAAPITWQATGGTISAGGLFTAGAAGGTFRVIASSGAVADTAAVTVTAPPVVTGFVLSPDTVALAPSGAQQFSASATWSDGATRPVTVTYSSTGGTVTSTGSYTAGASAGRFLVVALCACGAADTSVVTVAAAAPTLTALRLSPDTAAMGTGERMQFRVTGTMSDGSTSSPVVTWTATGGSLDGQGVYTAPAQDGAYTITATHAGSGLRATAVALVTGEVIPEAPETRPELPRTYLDTRYSAPTGRTIRVASGGNLQAALDAAQPGDEVVLAAGAEFRGSFWLRRKPGSGWITIRSDVVLPPEGTRVGPADAVRFAKIVATSGGSAAALRTANGASSYRIMGVEVTAAASLASLTALVRIHPEDGAVVSLDQLPKNIILDRVYVHGHPTLNLARCVALNAIAGAVVDSYLSECHQAGGDAQAIWASIAPGPFKIVNNYLAGSGENVLFGGSDPSISGVVPSDIEVRRNHFHKPLEWRNVWLVKNLFELKNAQRVLVEDNVLENSWPDGQTGMAFNLKTVSQGGRAPWSITSDVTIRYNIIRNANWAASIAALPEGVGQPARRIRLENNLFLDMGGWYAFGLTSGPAGSGVNLRDVHIVSNTIVNRGTPQGLITVTGEERATGVVIRGNVFPVGRYGVKGASTASGLATFTKFWSNYVFSGNGLVGAAAPNSYPGNFWADTFSAAVVDMDSGVVSAAGPFGAFGADAIAVFRRTEGVVRP